MKYWEIIADRLHAQGWSYGIAEHFTQHGFLYCVDTHRDGKRFIVKTDDLLIAFLSLERDAIATNGASDNEMRQASPRSSPINLGTKVSSVEIVFELPKACLSEGRQK